MPLSLELPWPPTVNGYRIRGRWRTPRGRIFRDDVIQICLARKVQPLEGPVRGDFYFFPPDRRVRDINNYWKALEDALTCGGVWHNDSQLKAPQPHWGEVVKGGSVLVYLEEWPDWQPWSYDEVRAVYFGDTNTTCD